MSRTICLLIAIIAVCVYLTGDMAQAIPYLPDAPPLPKLNEVHLKADISRDSNGVFTYSYEITNGKNSIGDLTDFEIDISLPEGSAQMPDAGLADAVKEAVEKAESSSDMPSDEGLANTPEYDYIVHYSVLALEGTTPMVPVTFMSTPLDWIAGLTMKGTASWGICCDNVPDLAPGAYTSGFAFQSRGIPAMRDFSATPTFDIELDKYYPDVDTLEDEADVDKVAEQLEKDREEIAFHGKTIGPTAPPENLVPVDFLQSIIDMKHEAASLGWITNKGVEQSLDAKLDAALKKLQSGNKSAAKNILGAFINEVEAQGCETHDDCPKGKHLSPEAYALLKYNAQYLIDNLK